MRLSYKRYIYTGSIALLFAVASMSFEKSTDSFQYYYYVVYNKAYFSSVYLTVFLYGMLPLISWIFIPEVAARFRSRIQLLYSAYKPLGCYAIYYTGIAMAISIFLLLRAKVDVNIDTLKFLYISFLCQLVGWFLIGCVFIMLYVIYKNRIASYLCTMLIFLVLTALMRNDEGLLDYVSPYNMMYALPWLSAAKILTILMICGVSLITLLMATHLILRKTDLLFRSRNVG